MLIPIGVDVPFDRRPFLNWLMIILCVVVFGLMVAAVAQDQPELFEDFVLDGYTVNGLFGHMWLHGGLGHLIGNMLFLWIFGNAVCSKIGNLMYLPVYIFLGLVAAFTFNIFSDGKAIGASGAVNGIVGMFLVFFPLNDITYFWMIYIRWSGTVSFSSFWAILMWFAFDIYGAASGGIGVAYTAHVGGFLAGVLLAVALLKLRIVVMEDDERSLLEVFGISVAKKSSSEKWEHVAPSGPREEAILRAAMDRKTADREESYEEDDYEISEQPAGQKLRFAYQQENYEDSSDRVGLVDDGYIRFSCECGKKIKVPSSYAGKNGKCPKCKNRVRVPG